jgi:ParB family chromosome partitioning protein
MAASLRPGGLGRGLDALLGDFDASAQPDSPSAREVAIGLLEANPNQPRKYFNEDRLKELAGSLEQHGMVQPIVVNKKANGRYKIITGERRYRAALMAGIKIVPIIERDYADEQVLEIALIENIQREDLNPVEEAAAISFLMQQHDLTQEEVAERLSKSRPAVTNTLRLLSLPDMIKDMLRDGTLSAGHGRALSALNDANQQIRLAKQAVESKCSVRALEQIVNSTKEACQQTATGARKAQARAERPLDADLYEVENRLRERLGTKVKIVGSKKRGKITIEYFSPETLQEIYDIIAG